MKLTTHLLVPDCHIPWHCKKSFSILLSVAEDINKWAGLNEIIIMGDFLDFFWVGLHPKLPGQMSIKETFKDEIATGCKILGELREKFPKTKITFVEGNHEFRLMRYIVKNCPALWDLEELTLPHLLKFKEYEVDYVPFGKSQLYSVGGSDLLVRHQPFNGGKHCAASTAHQKSVSLAFGHTHRKQQYTFTDALGKERTCYSLGWLGDRMSPVFDYMDHDNWAKMFGVAYVEQNTKEWWVDEIDIKRNKALYNGMWYEGREG